MKKIVQCLAGLFVAAGIVFAAAVPAHADLAPIGPVEQVGYLVMDYVLPILVLLLAVSIITGIVLLIVFKTKKKKRKQEKEGGAS